MDLVERYIPVGLVGGQMLEWKYFMRVKFTPKKITSMGQILPLNKNIPVISFKLWIPINHM